MNKYILSIGISTAVFAVTPALAQSPSTAPATSADRGMTRGGDTTPGLNPGANTTGAGTSGMGENTTGNSPNTTTGTFGTTGTMGATTGADRTTGTMGATTGTTRGAGTTTGVSRTTIGSDTTDLNSATFQNRDAFSSQVERRLDRLDAQSNTLSGGERERFNDIRDSLRDELDRGNTVEEREWTQYRNNITQDLDSLENMTGSGTNTQTIR